MKSLNHSVFDSFSCLKFNLQSGVLQPNNKTSCQNSEVDFPCSIVMGPKTVGSARWNSWELGISKWAPWINVFQMFPAWFIHTYRSNMATIGREMYRYGLHASGILVWFSQINMFSIYILGCSPYQDASQDQYIGIAYMEHLDMVYAPALRPYKSVESR